MGLFIAQPSRLLLLMMIEVKESNDAEGVYGSCITKLVSIE